MIVSSLLILGVVAKTICPSWYVTGHIATNAALLGAF